MYQDALIEQWDNLCGDFAGEFDFLSKQGNAVASFNRWYEARAHRWSSGTYAEGIILSQLQKPDFAERLRNTINRFRFSEVPPAGRKALWFGVPAGLLAGIMCGGVLFFLHWSAVRSIISGIVVVVVVSGAFYKKNEAFNNKEQHNIKDAYMRQLTDYRSELLAICHQFHVE